METLSNLVDTNCSLSDFTNAIGTIMTGTTEAASNCNYYNYPYYWWPTYTTYQQSKTEQAYKIVRILMKAKLVKLTDLEKFFNLMDEIIKVI